MRCPVLGVVFSVVCFASVFNLNFLLEPFFNFYLLPYAFAYFLSDALYRFLQITFNNMYVTQEEITPTMIYYEHTGLFLCVLSHERRRGRTKTQPSQRIVHLELYGDGRQRIVLLAMRFASGLNCVLLMWLDNRRTGGGVDAWGGYLGH